VTGTEGSNPSLSAMFFVLQKTWRSNRESKIEI
jgi:hypothetical protein